MTVLSTKERILNTTEKIISEKGFSGISLRIISTNAKTNLAAVNYHFGNKEKLIEMMLQRRLDNLFQLRINLLDNLESGSDKPCNLKQIFAAFISPALTMSNDDHQGGKRFMQVIARAYAEKSQYLHSLLSKRYASVIKRFAVAIQRSCPHLDKDVVFWRFHFIMGSLIYVMADFGASSRSSELSETEYFNTCCNELIDFAANSLAKPV
ncbi:Predicted transcriptional regulator for fatty acid degradation FadQ, TetR family [hydrothermal vent metagenome]|uniref:Predicted transcriptional regulator for fatty acid degradation FadQ, TetR family n=1 Tax=hydrothermal vent metagenome TaxID=652676 RepID=A0A3B0VK05_9ZZZZ